MIIAAVGITAQSAASAVQVDQSNTAISFLRFNPNFSGNTLGSTFQQEIITGVSGQLDSVDIFWDQTAPSNGAIQTVSFFINRGTGRQTDANDYTSLLFPVSGTNRVNISPANLNFIAGDRFVIGLAPVSGSNGSRGSFTRSFNVYAGNSYTDANQNPDDLNFITYVNTNPVPELPTFALISGGLLCLFLRRRTTNSRKLPAAA